MPAPAPPPRRPDARRRRRTTRGRRSGATRRRASRVRGGAAEPPRVACGACPPPPCHSCPSLGVRGERRARDGGVARELKEHIVRERREQRDVRRVGGARELDVPALHHDAFAHVDEAQVAAESGMLLDTAPAQVAAESDSGQQPNVVPNVERNEHSGGSCSARLQLTTHGPGAPRIGQRETSTVLNATADLTRVKEESFRK